MSHKKFSQYIGTNTVNSQLLTNERFSSQKKPTQSDDELKSLRIQLSESVMHLNKQYFQLKMAESIVLKQQKQEINDELEIWKENYKDLLCKYECLINEKDVQSAEQKVVLAEANQAQEEMYHDNMEVILLVSIENERLHSIIQQLSQKIGSLRPKNVEDLENLLMQNQQRMSKLSQEFLQSQQQQQRLYDENLRLKDCTKQLDEMYRYQNIYLQQIEQLQQQNNYLTSVNYKRCQSNVG